MNKFRKFWLGFVLLMLVLFSAYCVRDKMQTDSSGPVISVEKEAIEVSIHDGDDVLLQGVTAKDKKDGDVTDSLIVEKISNFYEDGRRTVTYAAFDSDNHISKVQRELSYTDYVSPRFNMSASPRFRVGSSANIDTIVSAEDCLDGDLSGKIKIHMDTTINNRVTGLYPVEYTVTNSAGDTVTLPINIEIYEAKSNEVQLNLKTYLIYYTGENMNYKNYLKSVQKGNQEYAFEGVTLFESESAEEETVVSEDTKKEVADSKSTDEDETVTEDSQVQTTSAKIPKSRVRVDDSYVVPSKPGVYPVYLYYSFETESGGSTGKEVLYVVVE